MRGFALMGDKVYYYYMISYEELTQLGQKVDQGTASEIEQLVFYKTIERGLDELIEAVDTEAEKNISAS